MIIVAMCVALLATLATAVAVVVLVCAGRTASLAWALALTVLAGAWLAVDKDYEIRVLWALGGGHGVTLGDLPALISLAVSLAFWRRWITNHRSGRTPHRRPAPPAG